MPLRGPCGHIRSDRPRADGTRARQRHGGRQAGRGGRDRVGALLPLQGALPLLEPVLQPVLGPREKGPSRTPWASWGGTCWSRCPRRARDEGRLDRELAQVGRAALLVVDELGFLPLDPDGARLLFQVVSEAYERQSVVITTNLEFSRWGQVFGDDQMAAAVIDRVVHHGRLLQFRGESYRVRHALMQQA